jgi:Asp-tRNA(Asn)/Glu-tRNA(Gln) amidotransferase A subunit family amidase
LRLTTQREVELDDIVYLPLATMAESIRAKQISPVELVDAHLSRIQELNPRLNAFVTVDGERARTQAKSAEVTLGSSAKSNSIAPLHGVSISIKSSIDVAGLPCECGSILRKGNVPPEDAPLVARLRAAGAIILGNTNVPEFLMAYETDNLLYGRTNNPWDLSRTPGGSSGGEAAAIAAGCSAGMVADPFVSPHITPEFVD